MFDVTITADSPHDLAAKVKALAALLGGTVLSVATSPTPVEDAPDATVAVKAAPKVKVTPAKAKPVEEPVEEAAEAPALLDFNTQVAPTVIKIVNSHGKPLVASVLETFGVAKASEMDPTLWPELLVALNEAAQ